MNDDRYVRLSKRSVAGSAIATIVLAGLSLLLLIPEQAAKRGGEALPLWAAMPLPPDTAPTPAHASGDRATTKTMPARSVVFAPPRAAPPPPPKPPAKDRSWEKEVVEAPSLLERVQVIDESIGADRQRAVALILKLLDHTPGANELETANLRAALVARLGFFKGDPAAVARLVSELDASCPRLERIQAVMALARDGPVPDSAHDPLARTAAEDVDEEVRHRARMALGDRP